MATNPGATNAMAMMQQQSQIDLPQAQMSQEHTASSPMQGTAQEPQNNAGLSEEDQQRLIGIVRRYKDQWSQDRIVLMQRCVANLELFKGNPNVIFGPGTTEFAGLGDWIGALSGNGGSSQGGADDDSLCARSRNFFQLLCIAFVSSLSPQLPKSKWMPEDADQLTDVATAKAAQLLIDWVERVNKAMSLFKTQLLFIYNCGSAYRHTRFVVDADRGGTKTEPVFDMTETEIMPARMHCFQCGTDNPDQQQACAGCNQQMGGDSFYPAVTGPVTRQVGTKQVPVGIVAQNVYSPMDVDTDPRAETIRQTPILSLEREVHLAAVRSAYPGMFDQIQSSATSELSTNGSQDRLARQQVYSQTDGQSSILSDQRPTLSETWLQSWAFAIEDDQPFVERMQAKFPAGCLLINTGATFLSCVASDVNKEWTVARAHEGFGMNPPCPGDVVRPFQLDYNDMSAMLKDAMDRCWAGITLANADLIDSKSFEGKPMLPGVLNLVKLKRTGAPGSQRLQDALHQFSYALDINGAMEYLKALMFDAQTFAGVMPQTYGGAGDPNIQTFGGQKQQLNTAHGTMGIYWENIKEEHATADELAVECAKANLTEDLKYAIEEKGSEFRNQYVRLDDLQGSVHAYSDIDQGLPITADELDEKMTSLVEGSGQNPLLQALFVETQNQEMAVNAIGIPGLVVPGGAMRTKTLQVIDQLLKSQPVPAIDPQSGQLVMDPATGKPKMNPSIMPDPDVDDFTISRPVMREYLQNNADLVNSQPAGYQNCLLYLRAIASAMTQQASVDEVGKAKAALAGHLASMPPPAPPKQIPPAEQGLQNALRAAGLTALANQLKIGSQGPLPQGESNQAAEAANADILQLVAAMEKLSAQQTDSQGQ
jgi:hypothetical protein